MSTPSLGAQLDELIRVMHDLGVGYSEAMEKFEQRWLLQELEATGGNQLLAAAKMRIHRNTLARRMKSIGLVWRGRIHYQTRARKGQSVAGEVTNSVRKGGLQEANSESAYRVQACLSIARKQNQFLMQTLGAAVPALPENAVIACSVVRIPDHLPAGGPAQ